MRLGLIVQGGVDRERRDVVPALLWLIERLAPRHDLHVFALHYYPEPRTYPLVGATVHDLGRVDGLPGLRRLRTLARLRAAVERVGAFDVLHAYWGMPAVFATAVGRRLRIPVIATLDSGELVAFPDIAYGLQRRWVDRRAMRIAIRRAARVTVSTSYMARLPRLVHARTHVDIVPFGIDTRLFSSSNPVDGPPWRLLRVANINPIKDYPTLLRAFAGVLQRIPDVHLDIVGVDTMKGAMQTMTGRLGIAGNVTYHGFQPTEALRAFYARAHLHVVSSRHEAASVAVLEASAAGVATVGTAVGYISDWAEEGRAVAVPVGNDAALGSAIVDLLHDGERRRRLASAAREWTLAHDADCTARRLEQIYNEVTG